MNDLNPIWERLLGRSQLSNPSDLPCWSKMISHPERPWKLLQLAHVTQGSKQRLHWRGGPIHLCPIGKAMNLISGDGQRRKELYDHCKSSEKVPVRSTSCYDHKNFRLSISPVLPPLTTTFTSWQLSIYCLLFLSDTTKLFFKFMMWAMFYRCNCLNGPLDRYVKLRVAHAPGMPGTFSPAIGG